MIAARHPARQPEPYTSRDAIDSWMSDAIASMSDDEERGVKNGLYLFRFRDPMYVVLRPIKWTPNPGDLKNLPVVEVPTGFVTDLTSVPRSFWTLLPRDGSYAFAAIIHDFLYWQQPVPKQNADTILKLAMRDLKINVATIEAIYRGVQLGGGGPWKANARLKANGERRLLALLPDDPTITWDDWKHRPGVFGANVPAARRH